MTNNHHPTDTALMALARAGDRAALGMLLARHYPAVLRLCRRLLGNAHDAHDVAQEAALQALLGLRRLQDPARFGAWLCAIAANLARMQIRRRRPLSLDALGDGTVPVLWPRPTPTPEEVQMAREVHDAIVAALGELPSHERETAIGFFLEGYTYTELAKILGVPISTVKGRLFKGRRRLQRALEPVSHNALRTDRRARKELIMSENTAVEVVIAEIRISIMTAHRVVVLREKNGKRALPIWIGPFEADAIALALQGQQPQRPMTHDLALRLVESLGATVRQVTISKILETTFYAELTLVVGEQTQIVDARPSDALALAARTGVPVFVSQAVMATASTADEREVQADLEAGEIATQPSGTPVVMERISGVSGPRGEPESPFVLTTLSYLYSSLDIGPGTLDLRLAGVSWDERFPTRDLEIDGRQLQAARLREGDEEAWLVVPPALWERVTRIAQQVIEREQRLGAALRNEAAQSTAGEHREQNVTGGDERP